MLGEQSGDGASLRGDLNPTHGASALAARFEVCAEDALESQLQRERPEWSSFVSWPTANSPSSES
jgi:hypothetical protein